MTTIPSSMTTFTILDVLYLLLLKLLSKDDQRIVTFHRFYIGMTKNIITYGLELGKVTGMTTFSETNSAK
jgi:hypothetical protein